MAFYQLSNCERLKTFEKTILISKVQVCLENSYLNVIKVYQCIYSQLNYIHKRISFEFNVFYSSGAFQFFSNLADPLIGSPAVAGKIL